MSHQDRRDPLPKGYQYEPWRSVAREMDAHRHKFHYVLEQDAFLCLCGTVVSSADLFVQPNALLPMDPGAETLWGV